MARKHWTEVEEEFMPVLYPHLPAPFLARLFGCSKQALYDKAGRMGLRRPDRPWTREEDAHLRTRYPHVSAGSIARELDRTRIAIKNRAHQLGLRKSDNPGRFAPGLIPWNKGMTGLNIGGIATQFKRGNKPHTWRPIGTTRENADGYLERKIADTGTTRRDYVPIHHLVWRMHGHSVPKGHALVFRDRDRRNFDINNLELITRRELMARNTVHNLPPALASLVQLRGALNRQINRRSNAHAKAHT